jgi:hypothetical protein
MKLSVEILSIHSSSLIERLQLYNNRVTYFIVSISQTISRLQGEVFCSLYSDIKITRTSILQVNSSSLLLSKEQQRGVIQRHIRFTSLKFIKYSTQGLPCVPNLFVTMFLHFGVVEHSACRVVDGCLLAIVQNSLPLCSFEHSGPLHSAHVCMR